MNSRTHAARLSLHIAISALFMSLVLLLGALLSVQSYNRTSDIILSSAVQLYDKISSEIQLDFNATYRPVLNALELLALTPLIDAKEQTARIDSLPLLVAALPDGGTVSAIQVGYANGDYFIVRPLKSSNIRKRFKAPQQASYVVDDISRLPAVGRRLSRLFIDRALNVVQKDAPVETDYDPRQRPWYLQAGKQPQATQPYLFYFLDKVGTTVSLRTNTPGVVIATDVSLEQLSDNMGRYRITPNSEAVMIGTDGRVLAYHDSTSVVNRKVNGTFDIVHISKLGSSLLDHYSKTFDLEPRQLDFEYQGQRWIGSVNKIARDSGLDLNILLLSPVTELLGEAFAIRRASLITTAVIIILSIPIVWLVSGRIAGPMRRLAAEADTIRRFDFGSPVQTRSFISEVDSLADAMRLMKTTINQFLTLINSLAGEKEFDPLLQRITHETMRVAKADAAVTYLVDDDETYLRAGTLQTAGQKQVDISMLADIPLTHDHPLVKSLYDQQSSTIALDKTTSELLAPLLDQTGKQATLVSVPLRNRQNQVVGTLCLFFSTYGDPVQQEEGKARIAFVNALAGFAAVSIESRHLFKMQEALLDAFIRLIASAIDAKSPYTGGHCQRVPELTRMLAEAACESNAPPFADFQLSSGDWDALHIASWLHDCGKVTTPEYVVDKATKLETIYDRIHEIRMRFEVLKRDAEIRYWQQVASGGNRDALKKALDTQLTALDDDFSFVAKCNTGGEFMAPEHIEHLRQIAATPWIRTLDDRIGISWEEKQRKERTPAPSLPTVEKLICDKQEHLIERADNERMPTDNPWGFKLDVPEYKYNRGELYNLEVARGTLSDEERFAINDHVVQSIIMLEKLPYPKYLRKVPSIAGGHHETMNGKGYPKRLTREETLLTARIMAIADIFEALTASDRPYKKAKTLSESIYILSFMQKDEHIDPDLFTLFLQSGVWRTYAEKYLVAEQIDEVDIQQYLD